ncbi:MAG: hypothetical protein ACERLG_01810 [Sedimentibacter sp.]
MIERKIRKIPFSPPDINNTEIQESFNILIIVSNNAVIHLAV